MLFVISTITGCVSISGFASLDGNTMCVAGSTIELKICVIITGIKKYKSINEKNEKEHDKIIPLAKSKLNSIKFLISKASVDSNISHDEFVLINNVLKEF